MSASNQVWPAEWVWGRNLLRNLAHTIIRPAVVLNKAMSIEKWWGLLSCPPPGCSSSNWTGRVGKGLKAFRMFPDARHALHNIKAPCHLHISLYLWHFKWFRVQDTISISLPSQFISWKSVFCGFCLLLFLTIYYSTIFSSSFFFTFVFNTGSLGWNNSNVAC